MEETIMQVLIAVLPALAAVLSVVGIAVKILRNFVQLKKDFADKTDYKEVQKALSKVIDENMQLKKELKRLQKIIDHVHIEEDGGTNVKENV